MPHTQRMSNDDDNGKKSNFPIDLSAIGKIKLAPGVTGKLSYSSVCAVVGASTVAATLAIVGQPVLGFVLEVMALGTIWFSNWQISSIAKKDPAVAILEGAEFVRYAEIQQSAKDKGVIIDEKAQPIQNPNLIEQNKG